MGILGFVKGLFGGGGKGVIEQSADIFERFKPGKVKQHEMSIESLAAGDSSQESARSMQFTSHDTWFDIFIDGLNRLPRPVFITWTFMVLIGFVAPPNFNNFHPVMLNVIWTIITFLFGSRVVYKDIPAMMSKLKNKQIEKQQLQITTLATEILELKKINESYGSDNDNEDLGGG